MKKKAHPSFREFGKTKRARQDPAGEQVLCCSYAQTRRCSSGLHELRLRRARAFPRMATMTNNLRRCSVFASIGHD